MNLSKLFQAQKELRERINYNGEDRFEKLVLALLVEIGECANEWRGFKFWSKNQEPSTFAKCRHCGGQGEGYFSGSVYTGLKEKCISCNGTGMDKTENPLLEEYVDGLHFVLELGIEINAEKLPRDFDIEAYKAIDITKQFNGLMYYGSLMIVDDYYLPLLYNYLALGEMLGFTWEQVEQGYYVKNQINHIRQDNSY